MSTSTSATPAVVANTKDAFVAAIETLRRRLESIPDDRATWSPSATARTPIEIVAHAAYALGSIQDQQRGNPFEIKTTEEADAFFRTFESNFRTKQQAIELLDENSKSYFAWLDHIEESDLDRPITLPFGLGTVPLGASLSAAVDHTRYHIAQLDYVQTIIGDRDWHL